jgi:DNA polymerase-3 subunit alpha
MLHFLIVQDFVNWAKDNGVVGPGRGSAAGSFVAYLTGITNIDPIEYKLLFERFLNPERVSMPDVDMDFADTRRDDVLAYVRKKYGEDHVAQIITFGTMAAKAAIRDVGRGLGFPYAFCDQISKMLPMFTTLRKAIAEVPELKKMYEENKDAKRLIDNAMKLRRKRPSRLHACLRRRHHEKSRHRLHPAPERLRIKSRRRHAVCVVDQVQPWKIGLSRWTSQLTTSSSRHHRIIKALGQMDSLAEKLDLDRKRSRFLNHGSSPLDDAFKLFQDARTTGIFQLESNGMKRYLKQLKPTVLEDIIAMVALYRPGPMEWIPDFIDGKHGRKEVKYLHPCLEPILRDTYGVAVYQEQVMQIARDLAGFTMGEADVLRKAMGKKIIDLIQEQRIKFINDAAEKKKVPRAVAEKVFSFIEPFAGYGFNRSHAACYALIGYQTAYLKAHYPAPFMAALLTSDQHDTDRVAIEVRECREIGIEVLQPDVNEKLEEFASSRMARTIRRA